MYASTVRPGLAPASRPTLFAACLILLALLLAAPSAWAQTPGAPTLLAATSPSPTQINLTWTAPTGTVTGYNVKRSPTTGGTYSIVGSPTAASFGDTGLTAGAKYYYVVTALNGTLEGPPSGIVSRQTLCLPPASLTATPGSGQVSLTWPASSGALNYAVWRGTAAGVESILKTGVTSTSYVDIAVTAGTTYYYVIKAYNPSGNSASSPEASAPVTVSGVALTSVSVLPTSVTGGTPSTGTVTLSGVVPTGASAQALLTSSNTAAATVPSSATVAAGASSVPFTVTTLSVAVVTSVTITAKYNGVTTTTPLTVNPASTGPTVATPASANPSPVTGTTTALSVLGADAGGEASLTYTWTVTGPAAVTYSANGTNAAQHTTATFMAAGTYTFTATLTDTGGLTATSPVTVVVNQTLTAIVVAPATAALPLNGTQAFTATANDQFGTALTTQPGFTWSLASGVGSVSAAGLYSAGSTAGTASVQAASGVIVGTASVAVTNAAPTVATPASANPSAVTATTTALSVVGADDGGEPALIYKWTVSPTAGVSLPVGGTNAAKNTTATFTAAGSYAFTVTITDTGGLTASSPVTVVVSQTLKTITVTPNPTTVVVGGTRAFLATGKDQFAKILTTPPTYTWSLVSGVGSINVGTGLYTAGAVAGSATVRATSGAVSNTAAVTVTGTSLTVTGLTISPNPVTAGGTATGTVTLSGNAPVGGTLVTLTSGNTASATVNPNMTVAVGSSVGTFPITAVAGPGSSVIKAAIGASSQSVTLTVNAASAGTAYRVDAGSSAAFTDSFGSTWSAETGTVTGGTPTSFSGGVSGVNTLDVPLYQVQRVGTSFTYTLSAPSGSYLLALLFAELDPAVTAAGQRVCSVAVGGQTLLTFDTFAAVGANAGTTQVVPVSVTGGSLTLTFTGTGTTGTAAVAGLQLGLLPVGGGPTPFIPGLSTPVLDAPAPGWGTEAIPMDGSSDSDGMGPSMGGPVNLASGVEENNPGADLWSYNPTGPAATYERLYRSQRPNSAAGYGSPGLSPGWTDNYDQSVTFNSAGSGTYTLHYDNDGVDVWSGTTGPLTSAAIGIPYLLAQTPPGAGSAFLTLTAKDRSQTTFTQIPTAGGGYMTGTYLLSQMTNLVGHSVTLNRDSAPNGYRVLTVTNDGGLVLLTFAYVNGNLSTVTDKDGRVITYGFTGGNLTQVSQINTPGAVRWQYGYTTPQGTSGLPALSTVQAPDPSNPGSLSLPSTTSFYTVTGAVASHRDALGNVRGYTYTPASGGGLVQITQVTVSSAGGGTAQTWKHKIGPGNVELGTLDAANNPTKTQYYGPYLPSAVTNENTQTATATYDSVGNPTVMTSPRGVQIKTTFDTIAFKLGQPTLVQRSHYNSVTAMTDSTLTATNIAYFSTSPFNGLVSEVDTPLPDTQTLPGNAPLAPTVPTTYVYDPTLVGSYPLGNVQTVTTVGPNSTANAGGLYTVGPTTVTYAYVGGAVTTPALGEPLNVTVSGLVSGTTMTTVMTSCTYDSRGNTLSTTDASGYTTNYTYNVADQPTSVIYPATNTGTPNARAHTDTAYQYFGGPASSVIAYDETNLAVREVDTTYDFEGQVASVKGSTQPSSYTYDGRGRVTTMTGGSASDGTLNTTTYLYDTLDNLSAIHYPGWAGGLPDSETYTYDPAHNLTSETDGRGVTTTYSRIDPATGLQDPDNLVYAKRYGTLPAGVTATADVTSVYDLYGRLLTMTDGTGTTAYGAYDDLGEPLTVTRSFTGGPQSQALTYAHNPDGSRLSLAWPANVTNGVGGVNLGKTNYAYDGLGRLTQTKFPWSQGVWKHSYLSNGWLSGTNGPPANGSVYPLAQTTYRYNPRGFLTGLNDNTAYNDQYGAYIGSGDTNQIGPAYTLTYDALGNKTQEVANIPAITYEGLHFDGNGDPYGVLVTLAKDASHTLTYGYDVGHAAPGQNRDVMTGEGSTTPGTAAYNTTYSHGYGYDQAYNPTTYGYWNAGAGADQAFSPLGFNLNNQFQSGDFGLTFLFDGDGSPTAYKNTSTAANLAFDAEDRLTAMTSPAFSATYDGDGLRATKTVGGVTTYYVYDGGTPVAEETWSGTSASFKSLNGWTADGWRTRYDESSGQAYVFLYDPQGNLVQRQSPHAYAGSSGAYDETFYEGYGALRQDVKVYPSAVSQYDPSGFGGQDGYYTDTETGLLCLTHRYYDPGAGRFLTRDPIGYAGGANLYGFCGGNPVNESDEDGFKPHHNKKRKPWYVQPQTITTLPGALLITNTDINVDDDGDDLHHSHYSRDPDHSSGMTVHTVDPGDVPYTVRGTPGHHIRNGAFNLNDFAVIIYKGRMAGGPALDNGHSVVGEASVKVHVLLGHPDVGREYQKAIDANQGAISIAFPGSGAGFHGPYNQQAIEAYSAVVYNNWAARNPAVVKQYNLPPLFHSH